MIPSASLGPAPCRLDRGHLPGRMLRGAGPTVPCQSRRVDRIQRSRARDGTRRAETVRTLLCHRDVTTQVYTHGGLAGVRSPTDRVFSA